MEANLSGLTLDHWFLISIIGVVGLGMSYGIHAIRGEIRSAARLAQSHTEPRTAGAKIAELKTTPKQRLEWRHKSQSADLIDLLDDIDALLAQDVKR
ncbi:MAG: hypothetical protein ABW003_26730 [Microvirga sp.]